MRVIHGLSALALVAWASLALAQKVSEPELPARPVGGVRPAIAATTQAWTADQQIAACLYNGCRNEVEISKLALERLPSNEARQFCEQMIAEHTAACEKLVKFAGGAVSVDTRLDTVPGAARREERREGREERREERREEGAAPAAAPRVTAEPGRGLEIEAGGARVQVQPGGRPRTDVEIRGGAAGGLNWVSIHKQIADQCLATAKQEFGAKEGAELERCYLGGQIMGHMKALDEIKVLRIYASPELRSELDACSQHCADHLKEAKVLAKKLEGDATRVSRKPDATEATKPE